MGVHLRDSVVPANGVSEHTLRKRRHVAHLDQCLTLKLLSKKGWNGAYGRRSGEEVIYIRYPPRCSVVVGGGLSGTERSTQEAPQSPDR